MKYFSVNIRDEDGVVGTVSWEQKRMAVNHPNQDVVAKVTAYLSADREFYSVIDPDVLDSYEMITANPLDDVSLFQTALCTLMAKTGVYVDWDTEVNS